MRVEALISSVDADEPGAPRAKLLAHARAVLQFNERHSGARFDGIHLDIEPQQRPENKGPGNLRFLDGLIAAYRDVAALTRAAGLSLNADIQMKLLKGDLEQRRALLRSIPRVTLMLYELSSPDDGTTAAQKAGEAAQARSGTPRRRVPGIGGRGTRQDGDRLAHTRLRPVAACDVGIARRDEPRGSSLSRLGAAFL